MDRATLIEEINSLVQSIATDLPVRLWAKQRCQLGCLLIEVQEFFLGDEYEAFVQECGLTLQSAHDEIS